MWYRLTNGKDHDYIIRQIKPFVESDLGRELGLDYKKLIRAEWKRTYLKGQGPYTWKSRYAKIWNGWMYYEIEPGDFSRFDLKIGHIIDLNAIRQTSMKKTTGFITKKIKTKKKKRKVKNLLGTGWSDCFKL